MKWSFWFIIFIVLYVYLGYPIFLKVFSFCKRQGILKGKCSPLVTQIIAAHDEEQVIEKKIENVLSQNHPNSKLQIIVASDASTDRTNEIVKNYSNKDVELFDQKEHKGKSAALNYVVKNMAKGEIIVFNDATTFLKEDAIKKLVRNFSDESVGAVCGKIYFTNPDDSTVSQNEGMYWKYEEFLRKKESKIGAFPFVSGAFYGIRKHLYTPVSEGLPDDSVSPLGVYKKGYRVVFEGEAVAYEKMASTAEGEFRIKSRGVVRELGAILSFKELLNPIKYPLLSCVLISHRLLRWLVGFFLVFIFALNVFLLDKPFYTALFLIQIIFYIFASLGFLLKSCQLPITNKQLLRVKRVLSMPFYFCLVNAAAMWGIIQFLLGKKKAVWEPVRLRH